MSKEMTYNDETSIIFINLNPLSLQIKFGPVKKFSAIYVLICCSSYNFVAQNFN